MESETAATAGTYYFADFITPTFKIPINFEMFQAYTKFLKNIFGFIVDGVIEEMMDGTVVFENDEFYIKKNNGQMIPFELEAEGLKKIGLLWQLLMTDNLNEDSILIWDEPGANLNPKFLPRIVECLLELSRHCVQIFLSTHNYIFAKYFDVAKSDNDSVLFHSLYFEDKTQGVKCETQSYFENLRHNDISAAFNHLLERVYQIQIGD